MKKTMRNSKTFGVALVESISVIIVVSMFCSLFLLMTLFYETSSIMQNENYAPIFAEYITDTIEDMDIPSIPDVTTVPDELPEFTVIPDKTDLVP